MTTATGRAPVVRRTWTVIVLELFVAAWAVIGGVGLTWNNVIGMPDSWLDETPFTSWVLPGVFLLAVVAAPMAAAAVLEWRRVPLAGVASVIAGAAQAGWIGAQLAIMQKYNFLQPVMLGFGLAVLLLALWARRHEPLVRR